VLRHAVIYQKIKEIIDSGKLGRIISVEANETLMPAHGGYIMRYSALNAHRNTMGM
jgi:predicted dehydrogenase